MFHCPEFISSDRDSLGDLGLVSRLWASVSASVRGEVDAPLFLSPSDLLGFARAALVLVKLGQYPWTQCFAAENLDSFDHLVSKYIERLLRARHMTVS